MRRFTVALALVAFTACGTFVNGRDQDLIVETYPAGANLGVDCGRTLQDVTPVKLTVPRAAEKCILTLSREGYEPKTVTLQRQESRARNANYIFGVPFAAAGAVGGLLLGAYLDDLDAALGLMALGGGLGLWLGSAPAHMVDERAGGAYKWVPAHVFVTLVRSEEANRKPESRN